MTFKYNGKRYRLKAWVGEFILTVSIMAGIVLAVGVVVVYYLVNMTDPLKSLS